MFNVVVANKSILEGNRWKHSLAKNGYNTVEICNDLSELVYLLTHEKIHFAVCSMNLIKGHAYSVLNNVAHFFPRTKIIVAGNTISFENVLKNIDKVIVMREFNPDLKSYCDMPDEHIIRNEEYSQNKLSALLIPHFWNDMDAAEVLKDAMPEWKPSYSVISITADSYHSEVYEAALQILTELNRGYALRLSFKELCLIFDNSPSEEFCLETADRLRQVLLERTNALFSIGISRQRCKASELYICVKEARRAASALSLFGNNSVVHIHYLKGKEIEFLYPHHKEKRLIDQAADGNKEEALRMLDEIFAVLGSEGLSQKVINKIALRILLNLNIAAVSTAKIYEKMELNTLTMGKALLSKSCDEAYCFLKKGIGDFADEMHDFADVQKDVLYMTLPETPIEITVSDLTKKYRTTVNFMNDAIKRNGGGNIFDLYSLV
ncbi:MAG: hypothetical protein FWG90_11725 [Oscillospiraceae bacterium]|nr:hypothetical protein [Oscillospiraceae bacterium]